MRSFKWISGPALMALATSACAATDLPEFPDIPSHPTFPDSPQPEPDTPTPAPTPAPDPIVYTPSGSVEFDTWREEFSLRAQAAGRDTTAIRTVLAGLMPMTEVMAASFNDNQAEFVKPIWDYVADATTPARVNYGRERLAEMSGTFAPIEASYAPPREILAAIWGMETSFGRILGSFDSPRQLASMAYKGRRSRFGEEQLIATMRLIESGRVTRDQLRVSSWAGAVGQTQFMPGTFLVHATDGDGDGRQDLWNSTSDALASAANYLTNSGWKKGEPWALEAILPANIDYGLADGKKRPMSFWASKGLTIGGGRTAASTLEAELFLPAGSHGPAFFLYDNFYAIKAYNNADSYALSIGLLADRLAQRPDLTRDWPTDITMLNKSQVRTLQANLNQLGYDAGVVDGIAGRRTRSALQGFQKDRGLLADGFPTVTMLQAVTEAANG